MTFEDQPFEDQLRAGLRSQLGDRPSIPVPEAEAGWAAVERTSARRTRRHRALTVTGAACLIVSVLALLTTLRSPAPGPGSVGNTPDRAPAPTAPAPPPASTPITTVPTSQPTSTTAVPTSQPPSTTTLPLPERTSSTTAPSARPAPTTTVAPARTAPSTTNLTVP